MMYKDIDGNSTMWKGYDRPLYKRILRKLYVKYVGDCYLPRPKSVRLVRERQKIHPKYGQITHIVIHGDGYEPNGTYILGTFGTIIKEDKL